MKINDRTSNRKRRRILLQQLEDRVLFSASPAGEIFLDPSHATTPEVDITHGATPNAVATTEYIFVDAGVSDFELLSSQLRTYGNEHQQIVQLDGDRDGLQQIAETLLGSENLKAIHILSHGDDARMQLGSSQISNQNLSDYASELGQIGAALAQDGDILIYGCDLAASLDGQNFIDTMSELTSADVAASEDTTGHASRGGDWDLEVESGDVEAQSVQASAWQGTLGGPADLAWVFGNTGVRVDFGSGTAVVGDTSATSIRDGFASWSDPGTGELVLYTNGREVWNGQTGRILDNGSNFNASAFNSQPVAVVPIPGERDQFYLFTVNRDFDTTRVFYSTIDMSEGVEGSVVQRGTLLDGNTVEGLDVIPHANGSDYWVLTYGRSATHLTINARQFDATGVVQTVTSNTALTFSSAGQTDSFIVHSTDYTQLAMGQMLEGELAIADFDTATGLLSNNNLLLTGEDIGYSAAFSPDGTKLYFSVGNGGESGTPHQYDLNTDISTALTTESGHGGPGLGADGKIYFARNLQATLSVVNTPNAAGAASNFIFQGLDLSAGGTISGARSSSAIANTIAVQPTLQNGPLVSLDADSTFRGRTLYIPLESTDVVTLTDTDAFVTDTDSSELVSFEIRVAGVVDGDDEEIALGGRTFQLGTSATLVSDPTGGTDFQIAYDAIDGIFSISNDAGGNMPVADVELLLGTATYQHTSTTNRTSAERTIKFVVNDGVYNSNAATAYVALGFQIVDNEDTGISQSLPKIASLEGGGYVIVWDSFGFDGSSGTVTAQLFAPSGYKIGTNFIANGYTDSNQRQSNVTGLPGGGFAVVFASATSNDADTSTDAVSVRIFDAAGNPVGDDILVNTYIIGQQFKPDITLLNDGTMAVVWQSFDQDGDSTGIYGQLLSSSGIKIGGEFRVSSTSTNGQENARVAALATGGFVVAWKDPKADVEPDGWRGPGVFAQRYDATATRVGDQTRLNETIVGTQVAVSVAGLANGGFVATWQGAGEAAGNNSGTFFRQFDENGQPIGGEKLVGSTFRSGEESSVVSLPDGGFYIAWRNTFGSQGIVGQRFNANGEPASPETLLEENPVGDVVLDPDLALLNSGKLALVTITRDEDQIVTRDVVLAAPSVSIENLSTNTEYSNRIPYSTLGSPIHVDLGLDATLANLGSTVFTDLDVTILNGVEGTDSILVEDQGTGAGQIGISANLPQLPNVTYEGNVIGTINTNILGFGSLRYEIDLNASASQAAIEALLRATMFSSTTAGFGTRDIQFYLSDGVATATSTNVEVAISPRSQEFLVNTSLQFGEQSNVDVTKLSNGTYLVSWEDVTSEVDFLTTRGQIYNSLGFPVTDPFFLATRVRDQDQRNVKIAALNTGGFVATWQTNTEQDLDASEYAIAAQLFDSFGNSVGKEISINTTESGSQTNPDVTGLPGGNFAIVWEGPTVGDSVGIALRVFDNAGVAITGELAVNTTTAGEQSHAQITSLSSGGDIVVTWQESNDSIAYRRFSAAGNALDATELRANTSLGSQSAPVIVAYDDGYSIAWQGNGPGDTDGIFLRRFDNAGVGLGAEMLVTESTTSSQELVSLTASQRLIGVVWSGNGNSGSTDDEGIWFRPFGHGGQAVGDETLINTTSAGKQSRAAVAAGSSFDEFFFAWESDHSTPDGAGNEDTSANGVFGRIATIPIQGAIDLDTNDSSGATGLDYDTSFMQGDAPVSIADTDASVVPVDGAEYTALSLLISGIVDANSEFLHFGGQTLDLSADAAQTVNIGGIDYDFTYGSAFGQFIIAVSGGASTMTVSELETVIQDFAYSNTASQPTESARTILWAASENGITTEFSTTTLEVFRLNASPTINVNAVTPYTQGAAIVVVDSSLSIADADDTLLEGAVVTISNVDIARDELSLTAAATATAASAGITVAPYNIVNGQLRMTGTATLAEYQSVLEGVQFYSLSPTVGDRTVAFVVNDGSSDSLPGIASIPYSVDTVPPPQPTQPIDMLAADDTGLSDNDNITQTTAPNFAIPPGTGTLGDTVTIYSDGTILGFTSVLADGSATYTPPVFADGVYQLSYSLTDIVGNESGLAPAISVTIDTQNSSGSLFITDEDFNTSTPRIRGASVTAPGEYLEIEVNGITYPFSPDGTFFSFDLPAQDALDDGTYVVTVYRHDLAGNTQLASGTINIDTVPPVIPTVNALTTDTSTPTVTGTATLGTGESLTVSVDGIQYFDSGSQLNVTGSTWSLNITNDIDPDGTYEVIAFVEDQAGNQSFDETVGELIVDTVEPSPPTVNPLDTTDTTPAVTGTAFLEPGESLDVTINSTTYSQSLGEISFVGDDWTLVVINPLPEGRYDVMAVSSDGAGNSTSDATTGELGIDLTPPANPTANSLVTADSTPLLTGTANVGTGESLTVTVDGNLYNVGSALQLLGTNWALQIPNLFAITTSGTYEVLATITDAAGNSADDLTTGELILDVVDPPIVDPLATPDTTPAITGTVNLAPGEELTVEVNNVVYTLGGGGLGISGSDWTLTIPTGSELSDGTYEVIATNTDLDGNSSVDGTSNELIIDTVAPAIPVVNFLSTNDTTPRIFGTANVSSTESLTVTVDGHTYGQVDPELTLINSNWSLQIPVGREITVNGIYEVEAVVTDLAGNTATDQETGDLVIDTLAPNAPTVDALATNDPTPAITGVAALGTDETLTVAVDGVSYTLGDGNLSISGAIWTLVIPTTLADGTYDVSATASDTSGNATPDATSNELIIDTIPPVVPTIEAQISNLSEPFLVGTATLDPTDTLTVEINGQVYDNSQPHLTVAGTDWSLQVPAFGAITSDGIYEVIAIVTDVAGNQSTDTTIGEYTRDTILPDAPVVDLLGTNQTTPAITGSATMAPDETLAVEVNGIVYTMGGSNLNVTGSNWTLTVPSGSELDEGTYEVLATVTDSLGNQNVDGTTNELVIDLTPPAVPVVDSQTTNDPTPLITGTAVVATDETISVRVNGVTYFESGAELTVSSGNWSLQIPVLFEFTANGTYDVEVTLTDLAGNVSTDATIGEFIFDTALPDAPVVTPLGTNDTTPAISGTANLAPDESLAVEVNGVTYTVAGGSLSLSGSAWTLVIPGGNALIEGIYEVVATATDSLGNQNVDGTTNELNIDLTPPIVPTIDVLTSSDSTPFLTGTATIGAGESLVVRANGVDYFEVDPALTVTGTNWSLQIPLANQFTLDGVYDIEAIATDAAGNVSTDATIGEFTLDTALPNAPTVDLLATNSATPSITGSASLGAGDSLTVQVDGTTYSLNDGNLSIAGSAWTLAIPSGNSLLEGTYEVTAIITDSSSNANSDATTDELIVDLTAPPVPTVDVLVTNDSTPLLTGTATVAPGDDFRVRVNSITYLESGPELTLAGTNWSLQIPITFEFTTVGNYEVEATVTDLAGNSSTDATTGEFTFDNSLPNAPVVDLLATNDTTPAITGSANLAGDETLAVEVNGFTYNLGDGNLGMTGSTWTLVIPPGREFPEGIYNVVATVTDSIGNTNTDATSNELTIDLTPPVTPTVNFLTSSDPTPLLTGTAVVGAGESLEVFVNGVPYVEADPHLALAGTNWSLQIPVGFEFTADGTYDIQATVTDLAGNASGDATIGEFTYDTTPPDAPIVDLLATNDTTPTITGTANLASGESLTVAVNGQTYSVGDSNLSMIGSAWTLQIPVGNVLPEGTYEVLAIATDSVGNANSDATTNELIVDLTPPVIPTVDVLISNDPTPLLTGTATVAAGETLIVRANGVTFLESGSELARAGNTWSLQIPTLSEFTIDGVYDIEAIVTDLVGNVSSDLTVGEFTYDTALPDAPVVNTLIINDETPTITGTVNLAPDESLSVEVNGQAYIEAGGRLTITGSTWALSIPGAHAIPEGTHDVTATVTDSLGNAASDNTSGELTIDYTPPAVPTVNALSSNDSTPLLTGNSILAAGEVLTVSVNGNTYVDGDGNLTASGSNWSLQIPLGDEFTANGTYNVQATTTDQAGNVATDTTAGEFIYDTVLPDAPTVDALVTNDQTPTITGSAVLAGNESLTVQVNGITYIPGDTHLTILGSNWTLLIPPANVLSEGTYDVHAVTMDSVGNANNDATSAELVVDLTPPATPSAGVLISNDATPVLTGTAVVGVDETLTVTINGQTYTVGDGNLTLAGNNWSLQIPPGNAFTTDGVFDVTVAVADQAGNVAVDPTSGEFTYDTLPPSAPTVNSLETNDNTPTITGTALLLAGETLSISVNGDIYNLGDGNLSIVGANWSLAIPAVNAIPQGIYEVLAVASDSVGNAIADSTTNELTIDLTPPATPTANSFASNDSTPLLSGTALVGPGESLTVDFNGVTYSVGDGNLSLTGNVWTLQLPSGDALTTDGTYEVVATTTDTAGNASSDLTTGEYTFDTALPDAPTVNTLATNDTTPIITGTANLAGDESLSVVVDGATYVPGDGSLVLVGADWTLQIPGVNTIDEGTYDVTATVVDSLGNTATDATTGELVIDLTPPAVPTVVTLISNDATPVLTGSALLAAGEFLTVNANGNTYVDGDGSLTVTGSTWSLQIPPSDAYAADGVYDVEATATDAVGNTATDITNGEFTLDTVLPTAPTVNALTTNDQTPTITGTALLAGDESLSVTVNGVLYSLGDGNLSISGADWTLLIPPVDILPEGIYEVAAVTTDSLGNANSDVTSNELVVDITPPATPSASTLVSNNATPTLTGTATIAADELLTVTVNGQTYTQGDGNLTVAGNNWSLQIPSGNAFTTDGTYDVVATVTDAAGNSVNDPTSGEFTYDTIPPSAPTVTGIVTNNTSPTISGTASLAAGESLSVTTNGVTYSVGDGNLSFAGGSWSLAIPVANAIPEGTFAVTATATDTAGNSASDLTTDELVVDLTPPAVPTVNTFVSNDSTPLLSGTAVLDPGDSLTVDFNGVTYSLGDGNLSLFGNTWSLQTPPGDALAADGTYDVVATATDAAGNSATDVTSGEYTLDSSLPDAPVVNFLSTNNTSPTITGTINLAVGDSLTVTVDGQLYTPGDGNLALVGSDWSLAITGPLGENIYEVIATNTNSLGSTNSDVTANELDIDLTPPSAPTAEVLIANDPTPLLTGTALLDPGGSLTVSVNGQTYTEGDGNLSLIGSAWTLQIPASDAIPADGIYDVVATSTDAAGNFANDTSTGEFTLDTVLPDAPTVNGLATSDVTPTITGTANLLADESLAVQVSGVVYNLGDGNLSIVGTDWSLNIPNPNALGDGTYEVLATSTDSLGNANSDVTTDELTIDLTPPPAPTVDLLTSNDSTPLLTGTATLVPGDTLSVAFNGVTYMQGDGNLAVTGSTWALQVPLADQLATDGTYDVTATSADVFGNSASDTSTGEFVLDTVPPDSPVVDSLETNDTTPTIAGTATMLADESLTVHVGGTTYIQGDGNLSVTGTGTAKIWTLQVPVSGTLAEAIYDVVATSTDSLGNAGSDVTIDEVIIDTTPPASTPTVNVLIDNDPAPLLSGTATLAAGELLTVATNGQTYTVGDGNLTLTGNTWSLQVPVAGAYAADGNYDVAASISDVAGNISADSTIDEYTLDTVLPAAPTIDPLTTNNTTPILSGTAILLADETLAVEVDGNLYSQGDGNLSIVGSDWTLAIPAADTLLEGTFDVIATSTDSLGNANSDATVDELIVDLTAPVTPTVNATASNSGTPLITGTAVMGPGEFLSVTAGGVTYLEGDGHLSTSGSNWLLQIPAANAFPTDGTYDITATVIDAAGNVSTDTTSGEFVLDSTLPDTATVNSVFVNNTTPTITGTAVLQADESLAIAIDGVTYTPGDGNLVLTGADWTLILPPSNTLAEGTYDVTATITDSLGNSSEDATIAEVTIDLTPPVAPTVDALLSNSLTPTLTGTSAVEFDGSLNVEVNGNTYTDGDGNLTLSPAGDWSLAIPVANPFGADGSYEVIATTTDGAGNATVDTSTNEFVLDTQPPAQPTVDPLATNDQTPTITGSASLTVGDSLTVVVDGQTYTLVDVNLTASGGAWNLSIPATLLEGVYDVAVSAADSLGNAISDSQINELTIDLTPPAQPSVDPLSTNDSTPTITGTAPMGPGETLTVTVGGTTYTPGDGNLTLTGTTWNLQLPVDNAFTTGGPQNIIATITDPAGNATSDGTTDEIVLTIQPPARPSVNTLITTDTTPVVTGTATLATGETLDVAVNGTTYLEGGQLVRVGSAWSLQLPTLTVGTYEIVASVTDSLGNIAVDATADELTIDPINGIGTPLFVFDSINDFSEPGDRTDATRFSSFGPANVIPVGHAQLLGDQRIDREFRSINSSPSSLLRAINSSTVYGADQYDTASARNGTTKLPIFRFDTLQTEVRFFHPAIRPQSYFFRVSSVDDAVNPLTLQQLHSLNLSPLQMGTDPMQSF